ncbi:MAG: undecaprenyl-diphosphate phosphatase [Patulibacter minatonensis]
MNIVQSIVLGVVEGLTEFLPVSSTGHLTITEELLGLSVDDASVTAFTAVVQFGAIVAVLLHFRDELLALVRAGVRGLASAEARRAPEWRWAWAIVAGSVPIGVVGLAAKSVIEGPLRSLWVVGVALIVWSFAMIAAERMARATAEVAPGAERPDPSTRQIVAVGLAQCIALIPGVSRSGATISGGLALGLDRVTATRLSFLLCIPALTGAGLLELKDALSGGVGVAPTLVGTAVAFVVAYASIAWLLRFVAHHSIAAFAPYRIAVGALTLGVLAVG